MSKGTPSMGKRNKKTHIACRRCGSISYHCRHKTCSACGFGKSSRMRSVRWLDKRPKLPTH
ncbi:MAG: 50S ribosomal protein L37e [Methanomicrobiales archaeon]|nr:50S ribosomal protein L37e [Methanomicrobiales archaeon]